MRTTFERLPAKDGGSAASDLPTDAEGRRALFSASTTVATPAVGSVLVDCSRCGRRTVLSPVRALRLMVPSLHLPLIRRGHPSLVRCPACRHRTWVRLGIQL